MADFSRNTFNKSKSFTGVRMQQGRVQTDADWNEQMDIFDERVRIANRDFIGGSGAPNDNPGYKMTLSGTTDFTISKGRYYVNGILINNEKNILYSSQSLPDKDTLTKQTSDGLYVAYLDVWQQNVNAIEDPSIREPALNGADTTIRIKNIAQVKLAKLAKDHAGTNLKCETVIEEDTVNKASWEKTIAKSSGKLSANVTASATLKNQLYRMQIHNAGDENNATFKWSRDNGALMSKIININGNTITISGIDNSVLNFKSGQWVELTTNKCTLQNKPGIFAQLQKVNNKTLTVISWPANTTTSEFINGTIQQWDNVHASVLKAGTMTFFAISNLKKVGSDITLDLPAETDATKFTVGEFVELRKDKSESGLFVRLKAIKKTTLTLDSGYDYSPKFIRPAGKAATLIANVNDFMPLENGLEIKFAKGNYKTGDYWLIPTRETSNNIASAQYDFKTPQLPEGILHYYAQLALVRKTGTAWQIAGDCRNLISALGNKAYQSDPNAPANSVFVDKNGNVDVKKDIEINGKITSNTLQVSGDTELKKNVTVTGSTKVTSLTASSNVNANSLQVSGDTELKKNVTVTGSTKVTSLTASSNIKTNNNVSANSFGKITTLYHGAQGGAKSSYTISLNSGVGFLTIWTAGGGQTNFDTTVYLFAANHGEKTHQLIPIKKAHGAFNGRAPTYINSVNISSIGHTHTITIKVNPNGLNTLRWGYVGLM